MNIQVNLAISFGAKKPKAKKARKQPLSKKPEAAGSAPPKDKPLNTPKVSAPPRRQAPPSAPTLQSFRTHGNGTFGMT
jgi:hypothetical protein